MEKIDINIRLAKKEDAEIVATIKQNVWKSTYTGLIKKEHFEAFNLQNEIERYKTTFTNEKIAYVVEFNNCVIGFFFIRNNESEINGYFPEIDLSAIYILDDYQRKGIGKKVFEFIKNKLKQENIKSFIVWCLETNLKGKNFYEKQGGQIIGSQPFDENGKLIAFLFRI